VRVSLFYNSSAGDGKAHDIVGKIRHHGHALVRVVEDDGEAERLLEEPCDVVVAAGGDGTVEVVARAIAGRGVPLAILPLGTANNIALALGIDAPIDDLIRGWSTSGTRPLDLGVAAGPWGEQRFIEGVGVGLIAAGIVKAKSPSIAEADHLFATLARTARIYRHALADLQPHHCAVEIDGARFTGAFLLIEVLNIPFVGPNLAFAARANPSDGHLCVTLARDTDREQLDEYLRHRIEGTDFPVSLPSYRGRCIDIVDPGRLHVDDEVYEEPGRRVAIRVEGAALQVLV